MLAGGTLGHKARPTMPRVSSPRRRASRPTLRPGDVVGFSSYSPLGWLIHLATGSLPWWGLSHVAVVATIPRWAPRGSAKPVLWESTTLAPRECLICKAEHAGPQAQLIWARIAEHKGRVWVYPLVKRLKPYEVGPLSAKLGHHHGRRYDYLGAIHARHTLVARLIRWLLGEDLEKLFCSEFVADGLRAAMRLDEENVSACSPNGLIRMLKRRGVIAGRVRLK